MSVSSFASVPSLDVNTNWCNINRRRCVPNHARAAGGLTDPEHREFGDESLTALVGYVDSLVAHVGAEESARDELRKHFPDNEVAEITLLASTYVLCASFLKSLGVQPDDGPVDWSTVDAHITAGRL